MNFKDKMLLGFILLGLWLLIVLHVFSDTAHSAESAIVSFNDAEHLVVLTDSVVGVCDTIWVWPDNIEFLVDSLRNTNYVPKDTADLCRILKKPIITCRELVCVTVTEHPIEIYYSPTGNGGEHSVTINGRWWEDNMNVGLAEGSYDGWSFYEITPGTAIINYRRVTQ